MPFIFMHHKTLSYQPLGLYVFQGRLHVNKQLLLIDSTGLKFLGEGEWKRKKHQPEYRRQWRKLNIDIDAKTLQIRAVQLTTNNISDSQVLSDLLNQIPSDERIDSVYTDGAYDTKLCRQMVSARLAHAVIPSR
ncbi:MAG: hypothetical protein GAK29_02043 [Acinetobacter bereziniae]|uniref:Transposase IS4-like domain-containing protein n=1 Tax=Acinetobacter bereziniae TaxID=106648 RepID=A0A833PFZ5_ACIBZ|nr:MAG: hypothetical protein GAK29_02043 [Acinetobacter bereziniae]